MTPTGVVVCARHAASEHFGFVFLEVGKFDKAEDRLESMMDKWMFTLKNMSRLLERPVELQERIFRKVFEAARIAAFTREELDEYTNDMMTENDRKNAIDYARKLGREEGMAEGEKRGIERGIQSVAERMLESGMAPDTIAALTGLSQLQVNEIQESQEGHY